MDSVICSDMTAVGHFRKALLHDVDALVTCTIPMWIYYSFLSLFVPYSTPIHPYALYAFNICQTITLAHLMQNNEYQRRPRSCHVLMRHKQALPIQLHLHHLAFKKQNAHPRLERSHPHPDLQAHSRRHQLPMA